MGTDRRDLTESNRTRNLRGGNRKRDRTGSNWKRDWEEVIRGTGQEVKRRGN
jgi:hypothetical protein